MKNADVLKILNKVGEGFGWQIGSVPTNYVNGYMQAIRDCKAPFYGKEHIGEANKKVEVKGMLRDCIKKVCEYGECDECTFFDAWDRKDGTYLCAIRDEKGNVPYYKDWDIESALMKEKVE